LRRFGKKGQGPGERQRTSYIAFDGQDSIVVSDPELRKNVVFNPGGNQIGERPLRTMDMRCILLIIINIYPNWRNDYFGLSGPGQEGVHVLDSCRWPNPARQGISGNRPNRNCSLCPSIRPLISKETSSSKGLFKYPKLCTGNPNLDRH